MTGNEIEALKRGLQQEIILQDFIETHISWLFFTENEAFKIKKPVKFSFLDFSTLEKRKHYCQQEVTLNQRLAPAIYKGVVAVRKNNQITIDGINDGLEKGKVIDHAVKMKRLAADKHMNNMLDGGQVNEGHIEALAGKIIPFHKNTTVIHQPFAADKLKKAFLDIEQTRAFLQRLGRKDYVEMIDRAVDFSNGFIDAHQHLVENRQEKGKVRDCHGDLHAGNIFLYKDPVIFDCIEFNDAYRQIDVLNDIAFLCMDLYAKNQPQLAARFIEIYAEETPFLRDDDDRLLLYYFMGYRANVRAKVNLLKAEQLQSGRKALLTAASGYLNLMTRLLEKAGMEG